MCGIGKTPSRSKEPIEYDFFAINGSIENYISLALLEELKRNQIFDFKASQANFYLEKNIIYQSSPTLYFKDSGFKLEDTEIYNHIPKKDIRPKYTEPLLPDFRRIQRRKDKL